MLKIGITGQAGFVGTHLYNSLGLYPAEFERIDFKKEFFDDSNSLNEFVQKCDVIIHLAALNRHNEPQVIYDTNIDLVQKLIKSLEHTTSKAHVIISSSTQEESENLYGASKKESREMFSDWADRTNSNFTGMIIPNVFGPFGKPYYNSVIATFCYQLTHDQLPNIDVDGHLNLIYVGDLVEEIIHRIKQSDNTHRCNLKAGSNQKVSEILADLINFRDLYFNCGEIPELKSKYHVQLFNTFRSFIDCNTYYPKYLTPHKDNRGAFVEIIRHGISGQISYSTTLSEITRGNHFHTRKIERFAVIQGKALIQLRKIGTEKIFNFKLEGSRPSFVDMPVWYTHNIKNIGEDELLTVFWINEPFDPQDSDTYFEIV
ncbi:MAG: SDR family oxidoreductase [Lutibacter sp.]|nr:SDR family oxidoreductase [Lutibacter sp.]